MGGSKSTHEPIRDVWNTLEADMVTGQCPRTPEEADTTCTNMMMVAFQNKNFAESRQVPTKVLQ